jgi:hypothetical protein
MVGLIAAPAGRAAAAARRWLPLVAALTALLIVAGAAMPAPASAFPTSVKDVVTEALQALVGSEGGAKAPPGLWVDWLTTTPNYAALNGSLAALGHTTSAIGLAALAAVVTLTVVHFWAAGVSSSSGGGDIVQGVTRTTGAGLFIVAWPWVFESGVALANQVKEAVLAGQIDASVNILAEGLDPVDILQQTSLLLGLLLALPSSLILIVLSITKIGLNAGLALCYAAVPLAVAFWPLPGFSWVAGFILRACTAIVLVPVAWALLLAAVLAVGIDALTITGDGVLETLTVPLVALALAILMFRIPGLLLRTAGVSPQGGVMRAVAGFAIGRMASSAIAQHVPDALGGTRDTHARQNTLDARNAADRSEAAYRRMSQDSERTVSGARAAANQGATYVREAQGAVKDIDAELRRGLRERVGGAAARETEQFRAAEDRGEGPIHSTPRDATPARSSVPAEQTPGRAERYAAALGQTRQADLQSLANSSKSPREVATTVSTWASQATHPVERAALSGLAEMGARGDLGSSLAGWTPSAPLPPDLRGDMFDSAERYGNALDPQSQAWLHDQINSGASEAQVARTVADRASAEKDPVARAGWRGLAELGRQDELFSRLALWTPAVVAEQPPPTAAPVVEDGPT